MPTLKAAMTGAHQPDLVARYARSRCGAGDFEAEIMRRADGFKLNVTRDFFFHMNPLYGPRQALAYTVGRYEAAYDALARMLPASILEIGCAHGLSTWLMSSYAERVVGLDISEDRLAVARRLFPEVEWVCADWKDYLVDGSKQFDVIVSSHGPFIWHEALPAHCRSYINIGYRATSWRDALSGRHKIEGRQLSFSSTLWPGDRKGSAPGYCRYFLRRNWLKEARHALSHGYALPM
jgi:SAM-dependent methyltransferase